MSDEEFKKEVNDLVELLNSLHLIIDKGLRKWLKIEIKEQIRRLLKD